MLDVLKEQLRVDETTDLVMEASNDDAVRDMFLDDVDVAVLGAENDPKINSLIEKIPPYEAHDPSFADEVKSITESALLELE